MKKLMLLGLLTAAACGSPTATPTLPPPQITITVPTLTPRPLPSLTAGGTRAATALPAPTPAEPQPITISAADGVALAAAYYPPAIYPQAGAQSAPAVLLIHMLGRTRADWDPFARELQTYGVAALALDLRGHGASSGPPDWAKAPGDVRAAWDRLAAYPEVDRQATAVIGASIGANLALIVGANNPEVVTVIALSPGLDYRGVQPAGVLSNFGQRAVLFVASQDDAYAYDSVGQMVPRVPQGEAHYFTAAGHGTDMLADASLETILLDWLTRQLQIVKG